ncbi:hypothetical protein ERO13_A02G140300v2 [Gossypium hirsutum]|uniref:Uncharacterized protein n=3 Tax=Gossypium TaxID=3633 RepID=A0A5J5WSV5_GOSBA|nr:hypothetical protein ES319_A02G153300v1 [Gossypium barbadense]KAG4212051.1 hypothetical protein ERO13_A02G140300v2 [Gossypium hirsutum]TYH28764.1 hypothetical protein ES288_A02G169900v1 [Gossypium darwinii]TYI40550.1 hypothetical protein ES332_A02G171000v1 [Gossypium tomentosum]
MASDELGLISKRKNATLTTGLIQVRRRTWSTYGGYALAYGGSWRLGLRRKRGTKP